MKIAVQMFGHLRTYDRCYGKLFENLINRYDCDIFIHTWDSVDHNTQTWHNYKVDDKLSPSEIKNRVTEYYKPTALKIEKQNVQDEGVIIAQDKAISVFGIRSMLYSMAQANLLREEYQQKTGTHYDYVVVIRPDIELWQPLVLEEFIQKTESKDLLNSFYFGGFYKYKNILNDWRSIGGSDVLFFAAADTMSKIFKNVDKIFQDCKDQSLSVYGPEYSFLHAIESMGMKLQFVNYLWGEKYTVVRDVRPTQQPAAPKKSWVKKIFRIHVRTFKFDLILFTFLPFNVIETKLHLTRHFTFYLCVGKQID